jgi:hypothetical protein
MVFTYVAWRLVRFSSRTACIPAWIKVSRRPSVATVAGKFDFVVTVVAGKLDSVDVAVATMA